MVRSEESKRLWKLAEAARDFDAMEKIESEWEAMAEHAATYWDNHANWDSSTIESDFDYGFDWEPEAEIEWTNEDEAALEEHEENRRRRIAEANEY